MFIRLSSPKEFWAGLVYIFFGCSAILLARDYEMGTATRMGPAYFPSALGGILLLIGLAALARGIRIKGPRIEAFALRPLLITIGAGFFLAATLRGLGLALALPIYIMITATASRHFKLRPALVMAGLLTVFCSLVFVKGLRIPLPLVGHWILSFMAEPGS